MNYVKNIYQNDRIVLKDALPLEVPLCISLEPTNLCNFKCIMCYHGIDEKADEAKPLCNMPDEIFEKTIHDLKMWLSEVGGGRKIKLIKLYSLGEPLIHPGLCDMLKTIKDADVCEKIEITTNASLLNQDIAEKFVEYGLDICRVSVYSVDEEKNKRITQSTVSPDVVRNNVENLYRIRGNASKPYIVAKMIDAGEKENRLFEEYYHDIADAVVVDELMQNVLDADDTYNSYYSDSKEIVDKHVRERAKERKRKACRYPFTHMTIRNDGKVLICCADWLKELCIGNVMTNTLKEIWHSKALYDLRSDMLSRKGENHKICRVCDIPYRDTPEDNIDGITMDKFDYAKG